jgi:hypothetical protein
LTAKNCKKSAVFEDICLECIDNPGIDNIFKYTISKKGNACYEGRATSHCVVSVGDTSASECMECEVGYIVESGKN